MAMNRPVIAITSGEPAGVGPELVRAVVARALSADAEDSGVQFALVGDPRLFTAATATLPTQRVRLVNVPLPWPVVPGQLDVRNAAYVLATLDRAIDGARTGEFAAIVTPPVHKGILCDAGFPFTGHTEYLAQRCGADQVVMLLVGGTLRVALVTTHLPLAAVPAAIRPELLDRVLTVLDGDLRHRFGLPAPRIGVAGLNPHAGEGGHLGREEIEVIRPAIERARARGIDAHGPLPADTLFVPAVAGRFDAILAMYHDQGLGPLKQASFGAGVNVTLGLPFVRTSVDHGTALDIAGTGRADPASLQAALDLAVVLCRRDGAGTMAAGTP